MGPGDRLTGVRTEERVMAIGYNITRFSDPSLLYVVCFPCDCDLLVET
jgi:hypothetical protein